MSHRTLSDSQRGLQDAGVVSSQQPSTLPTARMAAAWVSGAGGAASHCQPGSQKHPQGILYRQRSPHSPNMAVHTTRLLPEAGRS